jgi:hypothetical protein
MAGQLAQASSAGRLDSLGDARTSNSADDAKRAFAVGGLEFAAAQPASDRSASPVSNPSDLKPHAEDQATTPRDVLIALTYGLELVRNGAMLAAYEGPVHLANRAAVAILEKKDGLSLARTGLIAERASDTRLLQQLLQEAITYPDRGEPKGSPVILPRKAARTSLIVRVIPGPGLECWPGTDNRAALIMLYDEDKSVDVDEKVLSKLYGLTRGEAALAAILIKGKSIEEAAEELFISPHTAHAPETYLYENRHASTVGTGRANLLHHPVDIPSGSILCLPS